MCVLPHLSARARTQQLNRPWETATLLLTRASGTKFSSIRSILGRIIPSPPLTNARAHAGHRTYTWVEYATHYHLVAHVALSSTIDATHKFYQKKG